MIIEFLLNNKSLLILALIPLFNLIFIPVDFLLKLPCIFINTIKNVEIMSIFAIPMAYPYIALWADSYWAFILYYSVIYIATLLMFILLWFYEGRRCEQLGNGGEIAILGLPAIYLLAMIPSMAIYLIKSLFFQEALVKNS